MSRILDVLKKIGTSFRGNLGTKIVALLFAILLWNYVVGEANPVWQRTYQNIKMARFDGEQTLHSNKLTLKGDSASYLKKVNVTVELPRKDSLDLTAADITVTADVSGITKEGTSRVQVHATARTGQVVSVSPSQVEVTVERLVQKAVPVECVKTGTLPEGYWLKAANVTTPANSSLVIRGAASIVDAVKKAQITVSLDNLKQEVSVPCDFVLQDGNGKALPPQGVEFVNTPNSIVNLQVYPKKTVAIDALSAISGSVPKGYEITGVEVSPAEVEIAGPQEALDAVDKLVLAPIDVSDETGNYTLTRALDAKNGLTDGLSAVGMGMVSVHVKISMVMTQVTLDDLPVNVTGLSTGFTARDAAASVVINCPELYVRYAKASRVHLYADVTGLGPGTHTVPVTAEFDPEIGATGYTLKPTKVLVTISAGTSIVP